MANTIGELDPNVSVVFELANEDGKRKVRFKSGADLSGKVNITVQRPDSETAPILVEVAF